MSTTSTPPRILVVDDDIEHAATLLRLLRREKLEAVATHNVTDALDFLRQQAVDVVLTDLVMPGKSGLDLLRAMQHLDIDTDVILMTAFGTVERAVEAMHAGARDFIVKPIKKASLLRSIRSALERHQLQRENRSLRAEVERLRGTSPLVGSSTTFRRALQMAHQAAPSDATVLLLGESGTGKELFARYIHNESTRADQPFIPLHCAALPESIIESELFGHEAGAFTGARARRIGHIESANRGTLFLDEVGELPPSVQVKLLRFLQEGEIQRVGSSSTTRVDVRVLAATHRDLAEMVREGRFREDLYYRLNVIPIELPPLRDRGNDVELLAAHFLERHARRADKNDLRFGDSARRAIVAYEWPGNARELENAIERAVVLDTDGVIDLDDLPEGPGEGRNVAAELTIPIGTSLAEVERRFILATLHSTGGDKALTASILGVGRRTIYRKLEEYGEE